jgi:hypothetical protein
MVWALSVAKMDNHVRNCIYQAIASLFLHFSELPRTIVNIRYDTEKQLNHKLFGYDMVNVNHNISKSSLLETMPRLSSLFDLEDDLYLSSRTVVQSVESGDSGSTSLAIREPSSSMRVWCRNVTVTINHGFSAICVTYGVKFRGSNLILPIHIGPQLRNASAHHKFDSERDVSHYILEGWEDDFRCLELIEDDDDQHNVPDEVVMNEVESMVKSGFVRLTQNVVGRSDKMTQTLDFKPHWLNDEALQTQSSAEANCNSVDISDAFVYAPIQKPVMSLDDTISSTQHSSQDDEDIMVNDDDPFNNEVAAINSSRLFAEGGVAPAGGGAPLNEIVTDDDISNTIIVEEEKEIIEDIPVSSDLKRKSRSAWYYEDSDEDDDAKPPESQVKRLNMLSKSINRLGPAGVSDLIWDTGAAEHLFERLLVTQCPIEGL